MDRRRFLGLTAVGAAATLARPLDAATPPEPDFELEELTIAELSGRFTAVALAQAYLARIDAIDKRGPAINSVIELNPDAMSIAASLDRERKDKGPLGPMHGIPIFIKDNIETADRMH